MKVCELCGSAGRSNFSNTQWKRPQYETRCCKKCTTERRGAQVTSRATADITIISSPHGRQRREERGVAKSELQAAVKYGIRTHARSDQDGNQRWKYTYKGVVFLTDKTGKKEITSTRKIAGRVLRCRLSRTCDTTLLRTNTDLRSSL